MSVNGARWHGFDTSCPRVDISDEVRSGENDLRVRVASSLNNRLLARGYYDDTTDFLAMMLAGESLPQQTPVRDHGLLGPVRLLRIGQDAAVVDDQSSEGELQGA